MTCKLHKGEHFLKFPILAYHNVMGKEDAIDYRIANSPFTVMRETFEQQMRFLLENDIKAIDLNKLVQILNSKDRSIDHREKSILITFDDGCQDNHQQAFPVLRELGQTATFFVITGKVGSDGYVSWEQLQEMQEAGMQIESHTHSHVPLELLSDVEVDSELQQSKLAIEQHLSKSAKFLSFPHGSYTKAILTQAKQAGYRACGTSNTGYAERRSMPLELPRVLIRRSLSERDFSAICRCEAAIMFRQKLLQGSKNLVKDTIGLKNYMTIHRLAYHTQTQGFELSKHPQN